MVLEASAEVLIVGVNTFSSGVSPTELKLLLHFQAHDRLVEQHVVACLKHKAVYNQRLRRLYAFTSL